MSDIGLSLALGGTSWIKGKIADRKATALAAQEAEIKRINDMKTFKEKKQYTFDFENHPDYIARTGITAAETEAFTLTRGDELGLSAQRGRQESEKETSKQMTTINWLDRVVDGTGGKTNRDLIAESQASTLTTNIEKGIPNLEGATEGLSEQSKLAISLGLRFDATAEEIRARQSLFTGLNTREQRAMKVGLPITATDDDIQIAENTAEAMKLVQVADKIQGTRADPAGADLRKKQAETQDTAGRYFNQLVTEEVYEGNAPVFGNQLNTPGIIDPYESRQLAMDWASSAVGGIRVNLDPDTIRKYNVWSVQTDNKKVNPDMPYIMMRSSSDPIYKGVSPERVSIDLINQYRALPKEVFNSLSPQKRDRIKSRLQAQLKAVYDLNNVTSVADDGSKVIGKTAQFNWEGIGINWNNLPQWVVDYAREDANTRLDDPKLVVSFVKQDDGTTNMEVNSAEISPDDVQEIENEIPNSKLSMEDAAILYYAKGTNKSVASVRSSPSDMKAALSLISNSPTSVKGNMLIHPLLYRNNDSMVPRRFALEGGLRDNILASVNKVAYNMAKKNKPPIIAMDYDPRKYHESKLNMFAAAIDGEYMLMDMQRRARAGGVDGTSGFYLTANSITIEGIWDAFGIDGGKASDATGFSDAAYNTGVNLMASLQRTGVGSSFAETIAIMKAGLSTLPGELKRVLGNWIDGEGAANPNVGNGLSTALRKDVSFTTANYVGPNADKLKGTIDKAIDDAEKHFQDGQASLAPQIAEQKMLHAALVFYTAAAFQGEGGKAISDGDRKFVEWALGYGIFSNVKSRQAAIMGMLQIIAKADTINKYLSSGDIKKVYVAANYREIHGTNAISPKDWPEGLENPDGKYTNENAPRLINKGQIRSSEDNVKFRSIEQATTSNIVPSGLSTTVDTSQTDVEMKSTFKPYSVDTGRGFVIISPNMKPADILNARAKLQDAKGSDRQNNLDAFNAYYPVEK